MSLRRFARLARSLEQLFPERHLYVRSGGEMRGYVLSPGKQVAAAEPFAKTRADRLRLAFRLAGLDPAVYAGRGEALGGPLIESKDPRALAAVLDVDESFAGRVQRAASDLSDMRGLADAAGDLPLAHPSNG